MLFRKLLLVSLVATFGFSAASAEDAKPAMMGVEGMSYPMQKSMDPQVMMQMMTMMMDPSKASAMENCALCHEADDLARYAKDFGPMMESMKSMSKSVAPHAAMQQMNPMMGSMGGMNPMSMMGGAGGMNPMSMMGGANNANPMGQMMKPEQYTDWFNQMMKSYTPAEPAK